MEPPIIGTPAPGKMPSHFPEQTGKKKDKQVAKADIPPSSQETAHLEQLAQKALQDINILKDNPDFIKTEKTNPIITINIRNINKEYAEFQIRYLEAVKNKEPDEITDGLDNQLKKLEQDMQIMIKQMKTTASEETSKRRIA